jgi:membrane protein required for colicin V production
VSFSVIDFIFVALIGLFMIRCYLKGFISELLSMAAIILGLLVSLFLYKNAGELLKKQFWPEMNVVPFIAAFIGLFVIVFIIVKILEKILSDIIDKISLNDADSYIGIAFGLAEGVVVVSLVLFILKVQPLFDSSEVLSGSFFAELLLPLITGAEERLNV